MTITNVINELASIQLEPTAACRGKVHRLVDSLMPTYWLHHPLKANSIISRCRKDPTDLTANSFGCKDAGLIDDFQRASIYRETVFYAAGCDNGKIENADVIAMIETSKLHREGHAFGREKIAVSHWLVKRDIDTAIICHPNVFVDSRVSDPVNDMQRNYIRLLERFPDQALLPEYDKFVEFIASQFAKIVPEGENHQYMISAYFAHNAFDTVEGIIYPSVQTQGHLGFNVAIRPDVKDDALEFIDAQECVLYKADNYLPVQADRYSDSQISAFLGVDVNTMPWID